MKFYATPPPPAKTHSLILRPNVYSVIIGSNTERRRKANLYHTEYGKDVHSLIRA